MVPGDSLGEDPDTITKIESIGESVVDELRRFPTIQYVIHLVAYTLMIVAYVRLADTLPQRILSAEFTIFTLLATGLGVLYLYLKNTSERPAKSTTFRIGLKTGNLIIYPCMALIGGKILLVIAQIQGRTEFIEPLEFGISFLSFAVNTFDSLAISAIIGCIILLLLKILAKRDSMKPSTTPSMN